MDRDRVQLVVWTVMLVAVAFLSARVVDGSWFVMLGWATALSLSTFPQVPTTSGNRLSLSFGVASAAPLLVPSAGGGVNAPALGVIFALGWLSAWLLHQFVGASGDNVAPTFIRSSMGAAVFVVVYGGVAGVITIPQGRLVAFVMAALIWFAFETWVWALFQYDAQSLNRRYLSLIHI